MIQIGQTVWKRIAEFCVVVLQAGPHVVPSFLNPVMSDFCAAVPLFLDPSTFALFAEYILISVGFLPHFLQHAATFFSLLLIAIAQ